MNVRNSIDDTHKNLSSLSRGLSIFEIITSSFPFNLIIKSPKAFYFFLVWPEDGSLNWRPVIQHSLSVSPKAWEGEEKKNKNAKVEIFVGPFIEIRKQLGGKNGVGEHRSTRRGDWKQQQGLRDPGGVECLRPHPPQ